MGWAEILMIFGVFVIWVVVAVIVGIVIYKVVKWMIRRELGRYDLPPKNRSR
jgi:hypothetical protein